MSKVSGLIFDCDGVLFESRAANLAYYNRVLAHFGVDEVTPEDTSRAHLCHTAASPQVFKALLGTARVDAALEVASQLDYRQFIPFMVPEPHLYPTLETLAQNFPLAVATNRGNSMEEILRHFELDRFFQVVVTSRDVPRPKPYPDMLFLAAERLGLPCRDLLFVGDSDLDHEAARGAGVRFVAYKGMMAGDLTIHGHAELVSYLAC
ncbi:HAD family hydrolase [Desulfuromonas sp. KJ2020]|uniref:HAD family hydrolase n=1 Tax=Desulfuromonas sp. KJ2020 TaxID=2919173 RepID=UPI0020A82935|nr:HAD-IA family hydrolase [Desulfuromonas sp. KJ2020]MCP3178006.1 HAD family hydrolase [Desulfuromonas sp. KJ2020]